MKMDCCLILFKQAEQTYELCYINVGLSKVVDLYFLRVFLDNQIVERDLCINDTSIYCKSNSKFI